MNWFSYLPPAFSIYLLLISGVSSAYVKNKIHDFVSPKSKLKEHELVMQCLTLDWAARQSFFNSMFAAMVSVFSIWANKSYDLAVVTFIILLAIFALMMWWIMGHGPHELVSTVSKRTKLTPAWTCRIILILVNVILIAAIAYSQQMQPINP